VNALPHRLPALVMDLLVEARRRWYVFLPILVIWALAYARLFVDATPHVPILFNWTPSLPCRIAWLRPASLRPHRGDYVVFSFDGDAKQHYPGLQGQPFLKIVRGLPGDVVSVDDRVVSVNGEVVGIAKTHTHDRRPLDPIAPLVIPSGHYYVQGTSPDSFDSRYRASGLVRADQIVGTVVPLW